MIHLNLLPDIKREYLKVRRTQARVISIAFIVSIAAVAMVILLAFWVYAAQGIHKSVLQDSIKKNYSALRSKKDIDKYVTIQNQLSKIKSLHEEKPVLSRMFSDIIAKLNPKAPNNVRISKLDIDTESGQIKFDGETDTYSGLEAFRDTLGNATFSYKPKDVDKPETTRLFTQNSVVIVSQSIGEAAETGKQVVSFSIVGDYAREVFDRENSEIVIKVPTKDTTQSLQDTPNVFSQSTVKEEQ